MYTCKMMSVKATNSIVALYILVYLYTLPFTERSLSPIYAYLLSLAGKGQQVYGTYLMYY